MVANSGAGLQALDASPLSMRVGVFTLSEYKLSIDRGTPTVSKTALWEGTGMHAFNQGTQQCNKHLEKTQVFQLGEGQCMATADADLSNPVHSLLNDIGFPSPPPPQRAKEL